jgi:hypothetical protein
MINEDYDPETSPVIYHEISEGKCTEHCPACFALRQRHLKMRADLSYPPKPCNLTGDDHSFLASANITWEGDFR